VVDVAEVRALALGLPEAIEADHHGRPSFRVCGKIFATLWSPTELNVMVDEAQILAAVERDPDVCTPVHWGKRLSAVRLDLDRAGAEQVEALLHAAWTRRAPRSR
jgi:hypothetical protein